MEYIFSFSSRNSAFRFADAVAAYGGAAKLINSPINSGVGCGLAVKCSNYEICREALNRGHYASLRAVYAFDGENYNSIYNIGI